MKLIITLQQHKFEALTLFLICVSLSFSAVKYALICLDNLCRNFLFLSIQIGNADGETGEDSDFRGVSSEAGTRADVEAQSFIDFIS